MVEVLIPGRLELSRLEAWTAAPPVRLELDPAARPAIRAAAEVVARAAGGETPVYGVNTGFGKLASVRITRPIQRNK